MAKLEQRLAYFLNQKDRDLSVETKRILLKEILQSHVLDFLYNHPLYRGLNFYGGTCLHIIYDLNRLSEDLDLDNGAGIDLSSLEKDLLAHFQDSNLIIKTQASKTGITRFLLKFPVLNTLGLSPHPNAMLHLKIEISHHQQVAELQNTPIFFHGRSFVPAHFSLETMMAGKMIACIERNFQQGSEDIFIKGRDFYDLLWFMQQKIQPLERKLAEDGKEAYTVQSAFHILQKKIDLIKVTDLSIDLLPMFETQIFIESWLNSFHVNFDRFLTDYIPTP